MLVIELCYIFYFRFLKYIKYQHIYPMIKLFNILNELLQKTTRKEYM